MSKEPKDLRIPIMMSSTEVEDIDIWSFENRVRTRAEAVRRLCKMGLGVGSTDNLSLFVTILDMSNAVADVVNFVYKSEMCTEDIKKKIEIIDNSLPEIIETLLPILAKSDIARTHSDFDKIDEEVNKVLKFWKERRDND